VDFGEGVRPDQFHVVHDPRMARNRTPPRLT